MENNNSFLSKVYTWMLVGIVVSFATAYIVSINPNMVLSVLGEGTFIICVVAELAIALIFSFMINKLNPTAAKILFILYSFITGLTFSVFFIAYQLSSILIIFGCTGILFFGLVEVGKHTTKDLTKMGNVLLIGLLAIIIGSVVNIFLKNTMLDLVLTIVGLLIFMGITIYDTNKILALRNNTTMNEDTLAIYGAFQLYLDFINLFIRLLELFGKRND
jgi:FtsH-binding integral membrane protein